MRTLELMPLLAEQGVSFDFCTLKEGEGQLDEHIVQLGGNVIPFLLKPHYFKFGRQFVKFLKASNYDIVHSHVHYASGYIAGLAYQAGVKGRIVHFRNTKDGRPNSYVRKLYRHIMRFLVGRYATSILAVCRGAMEYSWGLDWEDDSRASVIYNGLDLRPFQKASSIRESLLRELNLPLNCKLIVNVGSFNKKKGHSVLLKAAAQIIQNRKDIHFLLIGKGPLQEELVGSIQSLGVSAIVHCLGVRNDVPNVLMSSDCFVLPSLWEGLPGVVLEAKAASLPIVATDLPGVREISETTSDITMVPVGDPNALAESIVDICTKSHSNLERSIEIPQRFQLEHCAEALCKIYKSQVSETP